MNTQECTHKLCNHASKRVANCKPRYVTEAQQSCKSPHIVAQHIVVEQVTRNYYVTYSSITSHKKIYK